MSDPIRAALTAGVLLAAIPAGFAAGAVAKVYWQKSGRHGVVMMIGAMALLFAWALAALPMGPILAVSLVLAWTLVTLTAIDLVCLRLPDPLTLPLLAAGLALSVVLPGRPILDHLAGAVVGYAALAILNWGYERWRGRPGVGPGDATLLGAAGGWLGWSPLPSVLMVACVAAFVWVALQALLKGRQVMTQRLAFGGPLCLATWIVWVHGPLVMMT